ncbi:beta-amyrin 6-beta-monooxygenase isoform X2 [Nicotiana sylvestris]|uniref:Beta-amyrin 28-oxidase n=3 Tax=Nicotiana TaxID=4085 RepID=A0A1S3ZCH2_TOBAC|nr:PREDICTED: beta-amyrin 28-oxidase isoform X1 [Nicotiana sylvestris]XP_016462111.1 PREDICTED: beta-amyrin 28-oxidase-like [Nicotiana tabacum]
MISYLLALLLLPLSLTFIFFLRNRDSNSKKLPPGTSGWPLLGENIELALLGPEKFLKNRTEKYSPHVFQTLIMGEKLAVFCGAQGNKFLFSNENKLLTSWWPKSMKKALLFPEFAESSLKDVLTLQRGFLQDILKPEALKQYIPIMDAMAREHLDENWIPNGVVKVFPLSKKYTFDLACRLFMSLVNPEEIKRLADPFTLVTNGMFSMPIDLPGTAYNRAIKGGKMVRDELMRIISQRRKELQMENKETIAGGRDLLSKILLVTDENGRFMSEMEISNNIIGMLVASFETTSSAVTSVLKYLAELPHVYDQVYKEQMAIAKLKGEDELLTWEDIEKMKYSWNVVRESLRLTPPAQGAFRETITDCTYAGFTIPKGWKTFWSVHSTHKNPKYFTDPEKFDPMRFEGSGPAPYTFIPFGGGPRMCPGKEYARTEVLVLMHNVVKRFKLEKVIPDEKIVFDASPVPKHGLPVRLLPHGN